MYAAVVSWLPSLLNPTNAAIAAALAIPALLLLYFLKLRRQPAFVGSTLLWNKAIQDLQVNSPFQKLRRNLLLILQLLLLGLLLFAFARPVTEGSLSAGEKSVILIDRSASMNATDGPGGITRLAEAKRQAGDLIGSMGRGDTAMVVSFDDAARTLQPFTADVAALREAVESITPSDRLTTLEAAYGVADAPMAFDPEQLRAGAGLTPVDVFLFSDGRAADTETLSLRGSLTYKPIGTTDAANVAVVALSARRNFERPTQVQVFARLANFGPEPVTADVRLAVASYEAGDDGEDEWVTRDLDGSVYLLPERFTDDQRKAEIDAGRPPRDSVDFTLDLTSAATIRVGVENVAGDALAADDEAFVFVPPPRPLKVMLVSDGNPWLEQALGALNVEPPQVIATGAFDPAAPGDADVIVFDRYSPPTLPDAGQFLYFGGTPPPEAGLTHATNDAGQKLFLEGQGVLDWKRDDPMLAGLNLAPIYVAEAAQLSVPLEAQVLVEGTRGPLIALHREGARTHLVAFDVLPSNWPLKVTFPVFMHNAVQTLALGSDLNVRPNYPPGTSLILPAANVARANAETIKLIRDGETVAEYPVSDDVGGETGIAVGPLTETGLYRTSPPVPQFERLAVNLLNPGESDLAVSETAPGGVGEALAIDGAGGGEPRRIEWWWYVAAAAAGLLLIEWLIYTRRVGM